MKALKITGIIRIVEVDTSSDGIKSDLKCARYSTCGLRDGGVMITDADAEAKGFPYNQIASLIAESGIYGTALIVGADGDKYDDVPESYLPMVSDL